MQGQENGPEDKNRNAVSKNSIFIYTDEIIDNYLDNLQKTLDSPQTNSVSLRILYYVDYLYFKKNK